MDFAIFQKKGNTKKIRKHHLSSEKMLGFAFLASLVVHLVAIYTIPAVDLFSEGPADGVGEIIEVAFVVEDSAEDGVEALSFEENQFAAAQPMPAQAQATAQNIEPVEDLEIATPPDIDRPLEDFTLLSQTLDIEPEFTLERNRPTQEPTIPIRRSTDVPAREKLPAKQDPLPVDTQKIAETPALQKPPVNPNQPDQEKPIVEDRLQFPSAIPALTISPADTLPEKAAYQSPVLSSKRAVRPLAQDMPSSLTRTEGIARSSKQRLVGLDKDSSQDENRFGIFAGEKFELPHMKDAIQEASVTRDELKAPATAGDIEQAKPLEVNTQIEGPLRGRALVYKPAPPQLTNVENAVELRLKFWVLPDGTIGEVIPLKRGDAQLERIAIGYLKQWQFEPLTSDVPQEKIWGTIPIIFTSQ